MAYILGFLYADGNIVVTPRKSYYVSFHTSDRKLLIDMRKMIKSGHAVSRRNRSSGHVHRLQIGSKEMVGDLVRIGLHPGKVRRLVLPSVPRQFWGDFIRGYFDGDGNVWSGLGNKSRRKKTPLLQAAFTSASHRFLESLLGRLKHLGIRGGSLFSLKKKNASRLILSTKDALTLAEIMYNVPHKLFLERKKRVFRQFARLRP